MIGRVARQTGQRCRHRALLALAASDPADNGLPAPPYAVVAPYSIVTVVAAPFALTVPFNVAVVIATAVAAVVVTVGAAIPHAAVVNVTSLPLVVPLELFASTRK